MEANGKGETGGKGAMLSSCLLTHNQLTNKQEVSNEDQRT
jgi:hypothetical protein